MDVMWFNIMDEKHPMRDDQGDPYDKDDVVFRFTQEEFQQALWVLQEYVRCGSGKPSHLKLLMQMKVRKTELNYINCVHEEVDMSFLQQ